MCEGYLGDRFKMHDGTARVHRDGPLQVGADLPAPQADVLGHAYGVHGACADLAEC